MKVGALSKSADRALTDIAGTNHLSARSIHRLLRVARTIADLEQRGEVAMENVYAAANLRDPQAQLHDQLAA
jgi:predicted ATPase with chaperone activity